MGSTFNGNIKFTVFGQSHSPAIGVTAEGLPSGFPIDMEKLGTFLSRRAPGRSETATARKEDDIPEFISGLFEGKLCGAPLTAVIRNTNTRSADYAELKNKPRPGHADYTAEIKFGGAQDYTGGGHFSGRLTAPLCIIGGICLQILEKQGIKVISRIAEIGGVKDEGELVTSTAEKSFPTVSDLAGEKMKNAVIEAKAQGDSLGGVIECAVTGLPVGLGDPMFGGMENRISNLVFAIPAVKGIEFGAGFSAARMKGSENNDAFMYKDGKVVTKTNNCGGILGGITNGMPLTFKAAVKPTPSIAKPQQTVDLKTKENAELIIHGRHDPCIVPRAVPCMEAAAAIAVYDALCERGKEKFSWN